ncbi:MAG: hypothetical protein LIP16_09155 [Clostridium sp.]|nr:hypothetical protein [Clostridium sp.]
MAKKHWGRFVAFAAVAGAVAAGISYVLQYKTYHNELEKDFREFEDGGDDSEDSEDRTIDPRSANRNYIALSSSKDEFKVAAKDIAHATKNVLKDAGSILTDTAHEAVSVAVDTAHIALHTMKTKKAGFMEGRAGGEADEEDIFEDEGFLDDDYVDEDDLYDYGRMDGGTYESRRREEDYSDDLTDDFEDEPDSAPKEEKKPDSETSTAVIEEDTID